MTTLWPLAFHFLLALLLAGLMIGIPRFLGERHRERATAEPYESGIPPTGSARGRLSARFYLVALLFVIFDVEAVFLIAWAISVREAGWTGFAGISVFIGILLAALVYEWKQGALDWGPKRARGGLGGGAR